MFARLIVFLLLFTLTACAPKVAPDPISHIVIDQFGYLPELQKRAVIRNPEIGYDAQESFTPGELPHP